MKLKLLKLCHKLIISAYDTVWYR